ncbi:MAG: alkaline phosphatase family protein [Chlorobi bacterium]|nr:alkaline phosphatase family protein [Chlorobiota bacterium]
MTKKIKLFIFLFLITSTYVSAQKRKAIPPEKPKLVIGIVVDQMRLDYIYRFWDKFGDNGFKRLINKGTICTNANYDYLYTQTGVGHATISTGTNPQFHGIISNNWYVALKKQSTYCVKDDHAHTVGGKSEEGNRSPRLLLTTNIGDELKLSNFQKSKVIGISLKDRASILLAGHVANAAYWMEDKTGNWITSSFYMDSLPEWVRKFNDKKLQELYLNRKWNTLLPIEQYYESLEDENPYEEGLLGQTSFPYDLTKLYKSYKSYSLLKSTPFGNTITKDFAIDAIVNENLGQDEYTDILMVSFSSTDYIGHQFGPSSVEVEDTYLRLDKELAHFIDFINENIGKENTLVFLTADHGAINVPKYLTDAGIPSGYFNYRKALSLLSSYLNALYGNGEWILNYTSGQLYLNHILIEDSKLSLSDVQEKAADFLIQFTGVANAMTASNLEKGNFTSGIFARMQKNYNQKRSGDVLINLEPGWIESTIAATNHNSGYQYDAHVPLIWYGWKVKRGTVNRKVSITDIAPTIATFLKISFPSGSTGSIIEELTK